MAIGGNGAVFLPDRQGLQAFKIRVPFWPRWEHRNPGADRKFFLNVVAFILPRSARRVTFSQLLFREQPLRFYMLGLWSGNSAAHQETSKYGR
jgi:hypothetical protein